jgi:hypothetical protein
MKVENVENLNMNQKQTPLKTTAKTTLSKMALSFFVAFSFLGSGCTDFMKSFVQHTPSLDRDTPPTTGEPDRSVKASLEPFTVHENGQASVVLMLDRAAPEDLLISWQITSPDASGRYQSLSGSFQIAAAALDRS